MISNIYNKTGFILVILLMMAIMPVFAKDQHPESVLNKNKSAIVKLFTKGKKQYLIGLGFIIQEEGLVLTSEHVIGSETFVLEGPRYKEYQVEKLVFRDKTSDLVLIKIATDEKLPVVELGNSNGLEIGKKLVTISGIIEGEFDVTNSVIEKIVTTPSTGSSIVLLENSLHIPNVMEGSPVFDQSGQVVGILSSANDDRSILGLTMTPINMLHEHKSKIKEFLKGYNSPKTVPVKEVKQPETPMPKTKKKSNKTLTRKNITNKPNKKVVATKSTSVIKNEPAKPQAPEKKNNFNIDLTGYWFDINTGHSIYLHKEGEMLVMQESETTLTSTNNKEFKGSFKRDGNKYTGSIEGTIDCKDDMVYKKRENKDICVIDEEVELVNWDEKKIELNINTINAYSCKECINIGQKTWKSRMWLRKNKKN